MHRRLSKIVKQPAKSIKKHIWASDTMLEFLLNLNIFIRNYFHFCLQFFAVLGWLCTVPRIILSSLSSISSYNLSTLLLKLGVIYLCSTIKVWSKLCSCLQLFFALVPIRLFFSLFAKLFPCPTSAARKLWSTWSTFVSMYIHDSHCFLYLLDLQLDPS